MTLIEGCNRFFGRSGLLDLFGVNDRTFSAVERIEADLDLAGDLDPVAVFQRIAMFGLADKACKHHIVCTAGHQLSAADEGVGRELLADGNKGCEGHGLAVILVHVLGGVAVPERIVAVGDLYHIGVQIKGQRIDDVVIFRRTVGVFVGNIGLAADGAHQLVQGILVHIFLQRLKMISSQLLILS